MFRPAFLKGGSLVVLYGILSSTFTEHVIYCELSVFFCQIVSFPLDLQIWKSDITNSVIYGNWLQMRHALLLNLCRYHFLWQAWHRWTHHNSVLFSYHVFIFKHLDKKVGIKSHNDLWNGCFCSLQILHCCV